MKKIKTYTATEGRKNYFKILDDVLNKDTTVYIIKSGSSEKIKITLDNEEAFDWDNYHGLLSDKAADSLEKAIEEAKKDPGRTNRPLIEL